MNTIGENIKRLREDRGYTHQGKFAKLLGVEQPRLSDWENGRYNRIELDNLLKIAKTLKVSINDLLAGVDADYDRICHTRTGQQQPSEKEAQLRTLKDRLNGYETMIARARELLGELHSTIVSMSPTDREPRRAAIKRSARQ